MQEKSNAALERPEQEPAPGDIRALKYRIHELGGEIIGYKRILDDEHPAPAKDIWFIASDWFDDAFGRAIVAKVRQG